MNKIIRIGAGFSLAALLSITAVGCSANNEVKPAENTAVSTTAVALPKAEKGFIQNYDMKLSLKDMKEYSESNYLALGETAKFTVTAFGTLDKNQDEKVPADGEVFYGINYQYKAAPTVGFGQESSNISLTINGTTAPVSYTLSPEGTLVISAPKDATLSLGIQTNGVTQSINLVTAERTTKDIASAWYESPVGKVDNSNVTVPAKAGSFSPVLKYSVTKASRTPYDADSKLGWADNGKAAWVILEMTDAEWSGLPSDANTTNTENKIALTGSSGKAYTPVEGDGIIAFQVPIAEKSFTLHTENSADVTSWGTVEGSTGNIITDKVKITFE